MVQIFQIFAHLWRAVERTMFQTCLFRPLVSYFCITNKWVTKYFQTGGFTWLRTEPLRSAPAGPSTRPSGSWTCDRPRRPPRRGPCRRQPGDNHGTPELCVAFTCPLQTTGHTAVKSKIKFGVAYHPEVSLLEANLCHFLIFQDWFGIL